MRGVLVTESVQALTKKRKEDKLSVGFYGRWGQRMSRNLGKQRGGGWE